MKLTITEIHNSDVMDFLTVYRYDCFLDDTFVMFGTWSKPQKFSDIVEYFVRELDKDWARVKQRLGKKNINKAAFSLFKPKTICDVEIKDFDLLKKKTIEAIRLRNIQGDFT